MKFNTITHGDMYHMYDMYTNKQAMSNIKDVQLL